MHPIAARIGPTGVWDHTETLDAAAAVAYAQRLEALGYGALWLPETLGRDPFAHAALLLAETDRLVIATGIANIWHRLPGPMKQAQHTLAEASGGRFLLGIGVSHAPIVEGVRKLDYAKPLSTMRDYLAGMEESPYLAAAPDDDPATVIAALGPKMLALAAEATDGAHPYWTTPRHTEEAAEALGPDKMLNVEQKICLTTDATAARDAIRTALALYIDLPNYYRNWFRLGFDESDLADGGSDRLCDALVPWGTVDQITARIDEHRDAGATHVCLQPLKAGGGFGEKDWQALETFAPSPG